MLEVILSFLLEKSSKDDMKIPVKEIDLSTLKGFSLWCGVKLLDLIFWGIKIYVFANLALLLIKEWK
jgi:hypothetical protein